MKNKIKIWLKRYVPAEILATFGALISAGLAYYLTGNGIISAYAGALGENFGFYGYIIIKDLHDNKIHHKNNNSKHSSKSFIRIIRNLVVEFGLAETLDSLIVRPFAMYIFPILLGNFALGIFVGKIAADVIFYIPVVIAYELRKKHLID